MIRPRLIVSTAALLFLVPLAGCSLFRSSSNDPSAQLPRPTAGQAAWQDLELGAFIAFEKPQGKAEDYNPPHLDTDQWVATAKAMGAKYAVLVVKDENGFLLWPSDVHDFSIKKSKWKNGQGDAVRDFVNSCRKAGIKPGMYIHLNWDPAQHVVYRFWDTATPEQKRQYNSNCERMLTELWSNYGEWEEVWFDGSPVPYEAGGPNILPLIKKLQPNAMYRLGPAATIRWGGNEDGLVGSPCWATVPSREACARDIFLVHGDPNGPVWLPAEADCPFPGRDWHGRIIRPDLEPLPSLMHIYYKSVGRNANLLLNMSPGADGRIPESEVRYYIAFGDEVRRRFTTPIGETKGEGTTLELYLPKPQNRIDHIILMEDITKGERVRQYIVEGLIAGEWKTLCEGISIGHKHIQKFPAVDVVAVRLRVTSSVGTPQIRRLAVFNVGPTTDQNYRMPYE